VAALALLPTGQSAEDEPLALTLLENVPNVERQLLAAVAGKAAVAKLHPIGWERLGEEVWLPQWREHAQKYAAGMAGLTPVALADRAKAVDDLARSVIGLGARALISDDSIQDAKRAVASALALALHRLGYEMRCPPGAPMSFHHGEDEIQPFDVVPALSEDRMSADHWRAKCARFKWIGGIGCLMFSHSSRSAPLQVVS
jgi:hypothetical protein